MSSKKSMITWELTKKEIFTKIFDKDAKKYSELYKYRPIIRTPPTKVNFDQKSDKDGKEIKRFDYVKVKLSTIFETGEFSTVVFVNENNRPTPKEVKNVNELKQYFDWSCKARFIVTLSKLSFDKSEKNPGDGLTYGFGLKCPQLEVTERRKGGAKIDFTRYAFGNGSEGNSTEKHAEEQAKEEQHAEEQEKHEEEHADDAEKEGEKEDTKEAEAEDDGEDEKEDEKEAEDDEGEEEQEEEPEEEKPKPKVQPKAAPTKTATTTATKTAPKKGAAKGK